MTSSRSNALVGVVRSSIVLVGVFGASIASAQPTTPGARPAIPIAVKVTEVAGDRVYVEPGETAGLRVGTRVVIDAQTFVVVELNATTAVLESAEPGTATVAPVVVGTSGTANPVAKRAPRDPSVFRDQWPAAVPPAKLDKPASVPLGSEGGSSSVTVVASGFGAIGKTKQAQGEARVIASFADIGRLGEHPLGLELDVAARAYSRGWNDIEHVPVMVRAAHLTWGRSARSHVTVASTRGVTVGRLRYAATSVGMLDGARVGAVIGSGSGALGIAAFGGLVPDPLGAKPSTDASRFGAELAWDDPEDAWQPRVAITALGSTWKGELDERRAMASGSIARDRIWVEGFVEAQSFADDNSFAAGSVELTGAGASVAWRSREVHAGAGVAYLRPERSLRVAAALPPTWLCVGGGSSACIGDDRWITSSASAGVRRRSWSVDAVATVGHTRAFSVDELADARNARASLDGSGYVRGEVRRGSARVFVAPSAGRTDFADWGAVELGAGTSRGGFEVSASYRPELLAERGGVDLTLHSVIADVRWSASAAVDVSLAMVGTRGDDRNLVAALTTLVWRAR